MAFPVGWGLCALVGLTGSLCLAIPLASPAPVAAETLVVGIGGSESTTRVVRFDTSLSVSGQNLLIPGAINAAPLVDVTNATVIGAQLSASSAGSSLLMQGSLADAVGMAPTQVVRNTGGDGLQQLSSASSGPTVLSASSAVPAVTVLGLGQTKTYSSTVNMGFLTVFP